MNRSCPEYRRLFTEYEAAFLTWSTYNKSSNINPAADSTTLEQAYQLLTDHERKCPVCTIHLGLEPLIA